MRCRTTTDPFFFLNDTATTESYTLSLHDALPIYYFGLSVSPCKRGDTPAFVSKTCDSPYQQVAQKTE